MTTGELIKVLADYCPDTPVVVDVVTTNMAPAGDYYTLYNDTTGTLHIRKTVAKENK